MENFRHIVKKYKVQIPIIQRDYAQGRTNRRASKIRKNFLNSIHEMLENNAVLHLDFIYGSIKQDKFIPLDGQQRLTTLFLLHWYFGKKENKDIEYLKNFTYETRASSREFCSNLVDSEVNYVEKDISKQIKDSSWFLAYWENDPSIRAMLTMIDDIHSKFHSSIFYDKLDNITFDFFELEKFGLDDDLYIKMNARGKPLTGFENFKAKFEKHLSQVDEQLKTEFSHKIDNTWTDFFWKYGVNDKSYLIDSFFMNYFNYITEMLHYKTFKGVLDKSIDFQLIKSIFDSKENIKFLFQSLDKLPLILDCFKDLFSNNQYEEGKVCLFDRQTNLLEKIIKKQIINIQQRILLFIIIKHCIDFEINDNLKNLLRIARNLTHRMRSLKNGYISYTTNLGLENMHALIKLFFSFINRNIYTELVANQFEIPNNSRIGRLLKSEIDKAIIIQSDEKTKEGVFRLEDFKYTKGDIHNFLSSDVSELHFYNEAIRKIFSRDDSLIIRSMLTVGNYSLNIGWSGLGHKRFFGKKNYWETILTVPNKLDFFKKYFESYKSNGKSLESIITTYLNLNENRDWIYYFVKYHEMTSTIHDISIDNNVYAWRSEFSAEKMGGKSLNAYHKNPYSHTAAIKTNTRSYPVQYNYLGFLECNELIIHSEKEGWEIRKFDEIKLKNLITKYDLLNNEGFYLLKETKEKDRIEILCDFINDIKNSEK